MNILILYILWILYKDVILIFYSCICSLIPVCLRSHGIEVDVDIPVFVGFSFISHIVYFTFQVINPVKNEIQ